MTNSETAIRVAAVIPARMGSSRFPGKPLFKIRKLPMVEHVRRRALLCPEFSDVVVATCDREIAEEVESYGGRVVMTSTAHRAATDRVAEATASLNCTHVVNVQGDEILVLPSDLSKMVRAITSQPQQCAWNAIAGIEQEEELKDASIVKCVVSKSCRILFCTRDFSLLPLRNGGFEPIRKILGILAYSVTFLGKYLSMDRTPLEMAEAIDQSRIIEYDVVLQGVELSRGYPGLNERREVPMVEKYLAEDPAQRNVLAQIL